MINLSNKKTPENKNDGGNIICYYDKSQIVQIFNYYEIINQKNSFSKRTENGKELKENCELFLNYKKINFCYKYNFLNNGKNWI